MGKLTAMQVEEIRARHTGARGSRLALAAEFGVTPTWIGKITRDIDLTERRFWARVDRREPEECWEWTGFRHKGYGQFKEGGRYVRAHRKAFLLSGGVLTGDKPLVLHSCDNPPCCNPAHLSAGDNARNIREREERGRGRPARGERNPASKLTQSQVDEMRARFTGARGEKAAFAKEFGIDPANVLAVLNGKTWKELHNDRRS